MFNLDVKWRPRGDRLLVLPLLQATASADGLILLADSNRERPMHGIVLAVGPGGVGPETGRPVPMTSQVGELIAFGRYAGLDFEVSHPDKGQIKVLIMRDVEALLARPEGEYELVMHEDHPGKQHEVGFVCDLCKPPTVDLEKLKDVAYGDVVDAEVPAEDAAVDAQREAEARANIEAERTRLRQLREAAPVGSPGD
jgi:chaperonin GroES